MVSVPNGKSLIRRAQITDEDSSSTSLDDMATDRNQVYPAPVLGPF